MLHEFSTEAENVESENKTEMQSLQLGADKNKKCAQQKLVQ